MPSVADAPPTERTITVTLTTTEGWLVREAIARAVRNGPFGRVRKRRLVAIAEHKILRALLKEAT